MSKTRNKFSSEVRARGADGWQASGRLWFGMGGNDVDCGQDRLYGGDTAPLVPWGG